MCKIWRISPRYSFLLKDQKSNISESESSINSRTCLGHLVLLTHCLLVINVDLIRAVVDLFYDGFRSTELLNRETMTVGEIVDGEEEIRDLATFVISGMFDKQVVQVNNNTNPNNFISNYKEDMKLNLFVHRTVPAELSVSWEVSSRSSRARLSSSCKTNIFFIGYQRASYKYIS